MTPRDLRRVRLASQHLRLVAAVEAPPRRPRRAEALLACWCFIALGLLVCFAHRRPVSGVVQSVQPGLVPTATVKTTGAVLRVPAPMGARPGQSVRLDERGVVP